MTRTHQSSNRCYRKVGYRLGCRHSRAGESLDSPFGECCTASPGLRVNPVTKAVVLQAQILMACASLIIPGPDDFVLFWAPTGEVVGAVAKMSNCSRGTG
jgi:hypothetical protein